MTTTAVILAAGLGSRLITYTHNKPKGLVTVGDVSMVEESIQKLIDAGIENIVIGTGYLKESYDQLRDSYPQIKTCFSPLYKDSSSLKTLRVLEPVLLPLISDDFLLLESDILYEKRGLDILINHPHHDVVLASGPTQSNDEVYIQANASNTLEQMSKKRDTLSHVSGELTGLNKVSRETFLRLIQLSDDTFASEPKLDYELALARLSSPETPVHVHLQDDFIWCEVDNDEHFERAQTRIYPKIKAADQAYTPTT